jgi:hypothetical protein
MSLGGFGIRGDGGDGLFRAAMPDCAVDGCARPVSRTEWRFERDHEDEPWTPIAVMVCPAGHRLRVEPLPPCTA